MYCQCSFDQALKSGLIAGAGAAILFSDPVIKLVNDLLSSIGLRNLVIGADGCISIAGLLLHGAVLAGALTLIFAWLGKAKSSDSAAAMSSY